MSTDARRIQFTVSAVPVAQPRQRVAIIAGRPRTYTPTKAPVNAFKATVRMTAAEAYDGPTLRGPIVLSALFLLPRPQRLVWKTKPMPRVRHTAIPDLDNLMKSLKDSLKGLLWADDSQVCRYCEVGKWYAAGDEQPHVEITLETFEPQPERST